MGSLNYRQVMSQQPIDSGVLSPDAESFQRFHTEVLPGRIAAGTGALAHDYLSDKGTLAVRTPAGSWTFVPVDGSVRLVQGEDNADVVVSGGLEAWLGLASDLDTAPGLLYTDRATVPFGDPLRFMGWEPGLRALFHGLPIFDPEAADLRDVDGSPLDPTRTFPFSQLKATTADAANFLRTAGYLCVSGVFDTDEVDIMLDEAEILADEARPGDMTSWWGRDGNGTEVLTRVLRAASRPSLNALIDDKRVRQIVEIADEELSPSVDDGPESVDRVTVLWKRPSMTDGLGDLPWHRDCGMGGHANRCPSTVLTICLTAGSAEAGELRFLPGSHRGSFPFVDGKATEAPDGVGLPIGPGDVTLHYSDLMHASLPPTSTAGPHRISVLMGFAPTGPSHHLGDRHYNDALLANQDGQIEHLGQRLLAERAVSRQSEDG